MHVNNTSLSISASIRCMYNMFFAGNASIFFVEKIETNSLWKLIVCAEIVLNSILHVKSLILFINLILQEVAPFNVEYILITVKLSLIHYQLDSWFSIFCKSKVLKKTYLKCWCIDVLYRIARLTNFLQRFGFNEETPFIGYHFESKFPTIL